MFYNSEIKLFLNNASLQIRVALTYRPDAFSLNQCVAGILLLCRNQLCKIIYNRFTMQTKVEQYIVNYMCVFWFFVYISHCFSLFFSEKDQE